MIISADLKKFFSLINNYKQKFFGLIFSLIGSAITVLLLGYMLKNISNNEIDVTTRFQGTNFINLLVVCILLAVFIFLRSKNVASLATNIELDIRNKLFNKLIYCDYEFFSKKPASSLQKKISEDIANIKEAIIVFFSFFLRNTLLIIGGLILLFYSSWQLALLLLIALPFVVLPSILLIRKLKSLRKDLDKKNNYLYELFNEALEAINIVQAYNKQQYCLDRINYEVSKYRKFQEHKATVKSLITSSLILLIAIALITIIWAGINSVRSGAVNIGDLTGFIYYAIVVSAGLTGMSEVWADLSKANLSAKDLNEILAYKPQIRLNTNTVKNKTTNYVLSFEHVHYKVHQKEILSDIHFAIKTGEKIAITGPSGAGKTTIFNLLLGFLKPAHGKIVFAGQELAGNSLQGMRDSIAYVSQEPKLFTGSFKENVRFGLPSATEAQIITALKQANLYDEIIKNFPYGINSSVGIMGRKLSLGQKQRLALARALVKNPKILLLDEATSNLDSKNEKIVSEAINKLMSGKTTLMITHKLSAVKKMDKVLVLNEGKIVDFDTHENLLRKRGIYYQLYLTE